MDNFFSSNHIGKHNFHQHGKIRKARGRTKQNKENSPRTKRKEYDKPWTQKPADTTAGNPQKGIGEDKGGHLRRHPDS